MRMLMTPSGSQDPTFRLIGAEKILERGADSAIAVVIDSWRAKLANKEEGGRGFLRDQTGKQEVPGFTVLGKGRMPSSTCTRRTGFPRAEKLGEEKLALNGSQRDRLVYTS
jgi:hypothetical protein